MTRVKRGVTSHRRHKKVLQLSKGFRNRRKNTFKLAKESVAHAGQNAYIGRKLKKRDFRGLWIIRLNAACRAQGLQYSRFIYGLELADIRIDRKMLSELAIREPEAFKTILEKVKGALPSQR